MRTKYETIKLKQVLALYYEAGDKYVGVVTKDREAVPGLLVFEHVVDLTLYQCAGSKHKAAVPKTLSIEEARALVRERGGDQLQGSRGFQSLILYQPPHKFTVEFVVA